jgi:hypothetical protein
MPLLYNEIFVCSSIYNIEKVIKTIDKNIIGRIPPKDIN